MKHLLVALTTVFISLSTMAFTEVKSAQELNSVASKGDVTVVMIHSDSCGYCQDMKVVLDEFEASPEGKDINFVRANFDNIPELATMNLPGVPAIIIGIKGQPVLGSVGLMTRAELMTLIESAKKALNSANGN